MPLQTIQRYEKQRPRGEISKRLTCLCIQSNIQVSKTEVITFDTNIARLQILAFFFCMRSCEYSDMTREKNKNTLCQSFHNKNKLIQNESPNIFKASSVSLTFEGQEKDTRDDTNTHQKANDKQGDKIMCPVRAAAELMSNLYKSKLPKNKIPDLKLNSIIKQGKVSSITSTMVLDRIRRAV